jgi:hypothetical protein
MVNQLYPTQYESGFGVQVGIDFVSSGELTQYEEDVAFEFAGQILYKPALRQRVVAAANAEGMDIDAAWLRDHSTVERRLGTWRVRLRAESPAQAERLAEIWRGFGVEELNLAREHALAADGLRKRQLSLEECLARAAAAEPSQGLCVPQDLKELQARLAEAGALISQERALSQGLSSAVLFGEFPTQPEPARVAIYGRAEQAVAGGLIGLVLGVWAVQAEWAGALARMWTRRKRG